MNKISIIKKIQLGKSAFSIEHPFCKSDFSFYCPKGAMKHAVVLSIETSNVLDPLLESGQLNENDLIENNILPLQKTEHQKGPFSFRYQIYNPTECHDIYLILFEIFEYRDYCNCIVVAVFQIELKMPITKFQYN